jgi:hypothetical protein
MKEIRKGNKRKEKKSTIKQNGYYSVLSGQSFWLQIQRRSEERRVGKECSLWC